MLPLLGNKNESEKETAFENENSFCTFEKHRLLKRFFLFATKVEKKKKPTASKILKHSAPKNQDTPTERDLPTKVDLILDSGASEFMFSNLKFASNTEPTQISITTAAGELKGKVGGVKNCYLPNGTEIKLGTDGQAVFAPQLQDNLASVGRLCEGGLAVLFDENGYQILQKGWQVSGGVIHKQRRDPSGLYPLTLYFSDICRSSPLLSISKKGEDISGIRNSFSVLKAWASEA